MSLWCGAREDTGALTERLDEADKELEKLRAEIKDARQEVKQAREEAELAQKAADEDRRKKHEVAMELIGLRNYYMEPEDSKIYGREFEPRSSDVFIVTYPKCGTTWMTQICHMLRGGSMDFDEITEVVPWDVLAKQCGQNLDEDQVCEPRLFKSHESWETIAKGGKYVYVARNPLDAFVSFYRFLPGYMGLASDDIDYDIFTEAIFAGASHSGTIWNHYLGWYQQRDSPNVLWVFFEDLQKDLEKQILRVADFMGITDPTRISQALEKSTFAYMSAAENKHHFDDHFVFDHVKEKMGLKDRSVGVSKVRMGGGKVGGGKEIPDHIKECLNGRWTSILATPTGCANYNELREKLALQAKLNDET